MKKTVRLTCPACGHYFASVGHDRYARIYAECLGCGAEMAFSWAAYTRDLRVMQNAAEDAHYAEYTAYVAEQQRQAEANTQITSAELGRMCDQFQAAEQVSADGLIDLGWGSSFMQLAPWECAIEAQIRRSRTEAPHPATVS